MHLEGWKSKIPNFSFILFIFQSAYLTLCISKYSRNDIFQIANDAEKVGAAIKSLSDMGMKIEYGGISRDIIKKSINLNVDTPGTLVQKEEVY